jgi:hypothetical protein
MLNEEPPFNLEAILYEKLGAKLIERRNLET